MKLNKSVHFNLLCVVAIVFVCVYLYYTISDVKKVAIEVHKHSDELAVLAKELAELKKKAAACSGVGGGVCAKPTVDLNKLMVEAVAAAVAGGEAAPVVVTEEGEGAAASIANTEDMKKFLEDADTAEVPAEEVQVEVKNYAAMTLEELKNQKHEDLREYCRANGISAKGTKEVLAARILA